MGSSDKTVNNSASTGAKSMITIETSNLKKRLNDTFVTLHGKSGHGTHDANFDRLWDLKELAILEGKNTVELPGQWLSELDDLDELKQNQQRH